MTSAPDTLTPARCRTHRPVRATSLAHRRRTATRTAVRLSQQMLSITPAVRYRDQHQCRGDVTERIEGLQRGRRPDWGWFGRACRSTSRNVCTGRVTGGSPKGPQPGTQRFTALAAWVRPSFPVRLSPVRSAHHYTAVEPSTRCKRPIEPLYPRSVDYGMSLRPAVNRSRFRTQSGHYWLRHWFDSHRDSD